VTKFTAPEVQRLLAGWLAERRFDVAVCDFLSASLNFPRELRTPSVLFQHNVESALWRRQANYEPNLVKRLAFKLEAAKMDAYERATVGRFQHVIAVSEHDRELMSVMTDPARLTVVPTGVDLKQYQQRATAMREGEAAGDAANGETNGATVSGTGGSGERGQQPLVLFLGSMDWEANIDGVDYFCREVWPAVRAKVPDARFRIVGRNPHARVLKLASESVEVTGTVPSVVEHLHEAAVFVVPLRVGGGTRLKIFEAMAAGKAVVSTTIGAEGLDVRHGENILLADDAESFARDVVRVLRDDSERVRLERAASALAARYDWTVIARTFEDVLVRVAGEGELQSSGQKLPLANSANA
jgi:glycosyltransferase involved in cell wall biosynthesis